MRKLILPVLVLLAALPAVAADNYPPNSALCWCLCDAKNPNVADGLPMWKLDKASCKQSEGNACNKGTANEGTLKHCDGCQTNAAGECIPGTSAIKIPSNATLLPVAPWEMTQTAKPLAPVGTAKPVPPPPKSKKR
jgi:hypothetical protein